MTGPVLALETSTLRASVALLGDGGELVGHWQQDPEKRGTAEVASIVRKQLGEAGISVQDLSGIAVGQGPGSYTGLRAGIALARGLALAAACPIVAVPSSAAAACAVLRADAKLEKIIVLVDARRDEVYRAVYERGANEGALLEVSPPRLAPSETDEPEGPPVTIIRDSIPDAYDVGVLGRPRLAEGGDDPATVLPLYLKRSHAEMALEERARS